MRIIAYDVETPNRNNDRMSAIGISVIEDGVITEEYYSLVNPETHFDYFNINLTGIDEEMVADAPTFPELWGQIEPVFSNGIIAAHNAVFDLGVLKKCIGHYGIRWKERIPYICTVQMGRRLLPGIKHNLNCMCDHYGISLKHHHAGSDSRACAEILLRYIEDEGAKVLEHLRYYYL